RMIDAIAHHLMSPGSDKSSHDDKRLQTTSAQFKMEWNNNVSWIVVSKRFLSVFDLEDDWGKGREIHTYLFWPSDREKIPGRKVQLRIAYVADRLPFGDVLVSPGFQQNNTDILNGYFSPYLGMPNPFYVITNKVESLQKHYLQSRMF
ncbi:MAG TPA: hypothetical protein PK147_05380, partial [Saprospiraceae bacterium]|nr:hypothetical protein [Saprospiraceae bacterium]